MMGINCRLEGESGDVEKEIIDPKEDFFSGLVQDLHGSTQFFRYIDPYGNTIFNGSQAKDFLWELTKVMGSVKDEELLKFLKELKSMAEICSAHPHYYLKFTGD